MDKIDTFEEFEKSFKGIDPVLEIFNWCKEKKTILALQNGVILTSDPKSSDLHNCKNLMESYSLGTRKVLEVDQEILAKIYAHYKEKKSFSKLTKHFSSSQQQAILYNLIRQAYDEGISDIHIEVRQDKTTVRVRRFGDLEVLANWPAQLGMEVAAVAFNSESSQSVEGFNPMKVQNTAMDLFYNSERINIRISTVPCFEGFDMVLRLLNSRIFEVTTLESLGYHESQVNLIRRAIKRPYGAVIISGPTGSGKSTTISSCLREVPEFRKIYTVEDPVETRINNTTQISVNTDDKSTNYASVSRALLRMDPDVIVFGEVRDIDVANTMVQAAITGHLVFTTLHTKGAINVVTRLLDMGVSEKTLSDPNMLVCLISQRLVPKLCQACAKSFNKKNPKYASHMEDWTKVFGKNMGKMKIRSTDKMCLECDGKGIIGRTVAGEILWIDDNSRRFIKDRDILEWGQYLSAKKWQTYLHHAAFLVQNGVCDPLDVEEYVGPLIDLYKYDGIVIDI